MALLGQISIYFLLISTVLYCVGLFYNTRLIAYKKWFAWLHFALVAFVLLFLWKLLFQDSFQYHYVWSHSSKELPLLFKFSSLWEGQEGSFLVWIFWNSFFLLLISYSKKRISEESIKFFLVIQACLLSMILGLSIAKDFSIGLSPFVLLKDVIYSPVYNLNPDFIPLNGTGMNSLLQNYWMVIHPPVIFLGFSLSGIPFSMCLAGLKNKIGWVNTTFPWMVSSCLFITTGMMMGAYWAYETLNFGGFWSWDPVENAIFIPWLISIVAVHLMMIYRKSSKAYKSLVYATVTSFLLVVYATFLTRSGVLGNTSVHSFTSSGLSNQLILFLFIMILLAVFHLRGVEDKEIKNSKWDYSFWVSIGMLVIVLSAFQVFLPTSFPVINSIGRSFGFDFRLASPVNPIQYYNQYQQWFAFVVLICVVCAQLMYWGYSSKMKILNFIFSPFIITVISLEFVFTFLGNNSLEIVFLIGACMFLFWINVFFLKKRLFTTQVGGALSHTGFGLIVVATLLSQGYKEVLTEVENEGSKLNAKGNVFLKIGEGIKVGHNSFKYNQVYYGCEQGGLNASKVRPTFKSNSVVCTDSVFYRNKEYVPGDSILINTSEKYFLIVMNGKHELLPKVTQNSKIDIVVSPYIAHGLFEDKFVHVSNYPDPTKSKRGDFSWITIQVVRFPLISLLWIGCLLLLGGISISLVNCFQINFIKSKKVVHVAPEVKNSLVHLIHN